MLHGIIDIEYNIILFKIYTKYYYYGLYLNNMVYSLYLQRSSLN